MKYESLLFFIGKATAMDCRMSYQDENLWELISDKKPAFLENRIEEMDYCVREVGEGIQIYYIKPELLEEYRISRYGYRLIPNCYALQAIQSGSFPESIDSTLQNVGIKRMLQPPFSLSGDGVLVGVVDTGIRAEEAIFLDEFGESKIEAYWDQERDEVFTEDAGNQILEKARDESGHGTALLSIVSACAPNARYVVVKCRKAKDSLKNFYGIRQNAECYAESDILLGLSFLEEMAKKLQMPMIILLAMGTNFGDHAGFGYLQEYLTRLSKKENFGIVVCGGNEGFAAHHNAIIDLQDNIYAGDLIENEYLYGVRRDIEIDVSEGVFAFTLECWSESSTSIIVSIKTPGGERITGIDIRNKPYYSNRFVLEQTELVVDGIPVEGSSGKSLLRFRFQNPTSGIWTLTFQKRDEETGDQLVNIQMWLPVSEFLGGECRFLRPIPSITLTEPGICVDVITVGAYGEASGSIAPFSGRGPDANGRIVPDITAPGIAVETVLGAYTGTGVAAALVAGASVLFFEWAIVERNVPIMKTETLKKYLVLGADRESDQRYPNSVWGYGRLNLFQVFRNLAIQ